VWIPGLVLGVGFAAAAWAKLTVPSSLAAWILNGTIKYHFVTDSVQAPVDWGLRLALYPRIAVLASFVAIATETLLVTTAFTRSERYRLLIGTAALGLIVGFWLFMGVLWPGWWILLLGFLPWQALDGWMGRLKPAAAMAAPAMGGLKPAPATGPAVTSTAAHLATAAQVAVVAFLIGQQFVASSIQREVPPMFSWYPMYSGTYSSPADWNSRRAPRYRIVASTNAAPIELRCNPHEEFVREFQAALAGSPTAKRNVWRELSGCGADISAARSISLEGSLTLFDWEQGVFTTRPTAALGPLLREDRVAVSTRQ
jgi:hypothetical protein